MKHRKNIKVMSNRFPIIINGLKSYGKTYPNEEMVRKMLQSLPKLWEAKVTAIEKAKNLEALTLNEHIGSLLTNKMRLNDGVEKAKIEKKKVCVAIKSTTNEDSESSEQVKTKRWSCLLGDSRGSSNQKLKANVATWSDDDSSDEEDQEVANLYALWSLMILR
ncbi:hypothetical protein J1N35_005099 [Gossypium stocksii]|uniref:UBN2 domain-containing protein n=1 Tax=Gossypium stocksii TaxID=47602 RepID=A0A9D4AIA8_9ROSI|nr:hypothetical protein J1N35_005099 [Gossypium stocksii]